MANDMRYVSVLSSRAEKEISSAWEWYEERQRGLGDKFVEAVLLKMHVIETQPEIFSNKHKYYREAILSKFPVVLVCQTNKKKKIVKIISVFHTSRNQKTKYK